MKIAGLQKTSLMDYPGNISCIVFTQGCNMRCPFCHNPELISLQGKFEKSYLPLNYFWKFLEDKQKYLDGVVITGGEPTLQKNLVTFIKKIKVMGLKVKLDTNGSNYKVIRNLINRELVDYIAMDVKLSLTNYNELFPIKDDKIIKNIEDSILLLKHSKELDYEFRTTVVPGLHNIEEIEKIAQLLSGAKLLFLQNFQPDITLDKSFQEKKSFPESKLIEFREKAKKFIDHVEIRD
ncbi:MAG: anaerobic ribonucleoside-triphosphate reductase activating protein [bacterium]